MCPAVDYHFSVRVFSADSFAHYDAPFIDRRKRVFFCEGMVECLWLEGRGGIVGEVGLGFCILPVYLSREGSIMCLSFWKL